MDLLEKKSSWGSTLLS